MRRRAIGFALASLAILSPRDARAAGAVVGKEGETVTVSTARVAVATTPARTTLWAQVAVTGASAGFVWILPVRSGARIDLGSDAWLDALDAATSPVVLPPSTAAPNTCDAGLSPQQLPPASSPRSGLPSATGLFTDPVALQSFVTGAGYAIPAGLTSALGPVFADGAVIASTYATASQPVRTLRVVDSGPPLLPFALTGVLESTTQATAFVVASAGAAAGSSPLTLDPSHVLWVSDGLSSFVQARANLLGAWQGTRWLTESAAPGLLFDGAALGSGATLPAVVGQYFSLARAYGDATGDPTECATAALSGQSDSDPYVAACPVGTLGIVPGPSPCSTGADGDASTGPDGGAPIDALFCGGSADDAALAVAGLAAPGIWVSRIEGIVTQATASDVPLSIAVTPPSSPVVTAGGYESTCEEAPSPSPTTSLPVLPPSGPTASSQAPQQSSSSSASSADVGAAAAEGCSGAAEACGSSQSTDDESDDSGDCSGDSSTDSGDACSGDASSSSDCATGRGSHRRRGRSPVSRLLMVLVAGLAIARRCTPRSRRASPEAGHA
jgi:Uncharacterized protein conserved in bacteria (DUF2330)